MFAKDEASLKGFHCLRPSEAGCLVEAVCP